jgi:hypothetical protein
MDIKAFIFIFGSIPLLWFIQTQGMHVPFPHDELVYLLGVGSGVFTMFFFTRFIKG